MAKTLNQLVNEGTQISRQLTSGDIPILCRGCDEVTLELKEYEGAYWVELKLHRKAISVEELKSIINKKV